MSATVEDFTLHHRGSKRAVPVRGYPAVGSPRGWILFSVGFGGDRDGYAFYARSWSSIGLATFVIEHVGSNLDVLRSLPQTRRAERNAEVVRRVGLPDELRARPQDVELVWEHLQETYEGLPLGLGGHSYGSYSVLACLGMEPKVTSHDVDALPAEGALVISPQPPGLLFDEEQYRKVDTQTLVLTGTRDHLLSGRSDYRERLRAYDLLAGPNKQGLVLKGFEHMDFAGVGLGLGEKLKVLQELSCRWWRHSLLAEALSPDWAEQISSEVELVCR